MTIPPGRRRAALAMLVVSAVAVGAVLLLGRSDRSARAETVYDQRCGYCHDVEGMIGVSLDARVLRSYGDARRLFEYVRLAMPYDAARTLSDEEYWLTVAYLLRSRGLVDEGTRVDASTAEGITFD